MTSKYRRRARWGGLIIGCAFLVALGTVRSIAQTPPGRPAQPAASIYAALDTLPKLNGLWTLYSTADVYQHIVAILRDAPFRPESQDLLNAAFKNADVTAGTYCRPPRFGGINEAGEAMLEILFTPGRVTLVGTQGLVRRIYTDGRSLPADPETSNGGTSVGHWEGTTLVVETVGLNPDAQLPPGIRGAPRLGKNAKVTERMFLKARDVLQIDSTIRAPEMLTAPLSMQWTYARSFESQVHEYTSCVDDDRAIDPVTGEQRFDMTPPVDLPPPPAK